MEDGVLGGDVLEDGVLGGGVLGGGVLGGGVLEDGASEAESFSDLGDLEANEGRSAG